MVRAVIGPLLLLVVCPLAVDFFAATMLDEELDGSILAALQSPPSLA